MTSSSAPLAQPEVEEPRKRRRTLADIPNPEPVRIPERPRARSGRVPGVDPSKLDPGLGPDPDLGVEAPPAPAAEPRPQPTKPTAPSEPPAGVPTLRVVEDLDPDEVEPEPTPFDIDDEDTDHGMGPVSPPRAAASADDGFDDDVDDIEDLDDLDDDDDFDGDFDPALAPPPGYRPPE